MNHVHMWSALVCLSDERSHEAYGSELALLISCLVTETCLLAWYKLVNTMILNDNGYRIGYMYGDFSRERHVTLYTVFLRGYWRLDTLVIIYSCYK